MSILIALESIRGLMQQAHDNAVAKGFWNPTFTIGGEEHMMTVEEATADPIVLTAKAALITTETAEMIEALRKPCPDQHLPAFRSEEVEWADQLIRLFDYGHALGFHPETILEKMAFNEGRVFMHGKRL